MAVTRLYVNKFKFARLASLSPHMEELKRKSYIKFSQQFRATYFQFREPYKELR